MIYTTDNTLTTVTYTYGANVAVPANMGLYSTNSGVTTRTDVVIGSVVVDTPTVCTATDVDVPEVGLHVLDFREESVADLDTAGASTVSIKKVTVSKVATTNSISV